MNIGEKVKQYLDTKEQRVATGVDPSSKRSTKEKPNPRKEWNLLKADLVEDKVELVERLAKEYSKPVAGLKQAHARVQHARQARVPGDFLSRRDRAHADLERLRRPDRVDVQRSRQERSQKACGQKYREITQTRSPRSRRATRTAKPPPSTDRSLAGKTARLLRAAGASIKAIDSKTTTNTHRSDSPALRSRKIRKNPRTNPAPRDRVPRAARNRGLPRDKKSTSS